MAEKKVTEKKTVKKVEQIKELNIALDEEKKKESAVQVP